MELLCCLILFVSYATSQQIDLTHFLSDGKVDSDNVLNAFKDFTNRKDVIVLELNDKYKSFQHVKNPDDINSILDYEDIDSVEKGLRAHDEDTNRSLYGFSADYIDMAELARAEAELMEKGKQLIELKKKLKAPTYSKLTKYLLSKLLKDNDQEVWIDENGDKITPYLGRRSHKKSQSSSESETSKSSEEKARKKESKDDQKAKKSSKKKKKSSSEETDSEESTNEVTTRRPRPKRKKKTKPEENYEIMQSPFRKLKTRKSYRLPHFLPKRYTWTSKEMGELGYLWFNGNQGKNPP